MKLCSTCSGMRFVVVRKPETVSKVFYRKPDGSACWPCDGGTPVRETFTTGRTVGISEVCTDCQGSGLALDPAHNPDCTQCHGTGERKAWDSDGDWVTEDCQCTAAVRLNVVEAAFLGRRSM